VAPPGSNVTHLKSSSELEVTDGAESSDTDNKELTEEQLEQAYEQK
jgi:hypothetical protein